MSWRPGLDPGPAGEPTALPRPIAGQKGGKGQDKGTREERKRDGRGEKKIGRGKEGRGREMKTEEGREKVWVFRQLQLIDTPVSVRPPTEARLAMIRKDQAIHVYFGRPRMK